MVTTCSIEGCLEKHNSRGWCLKHYTCWKRTGDPIPKVKPHRKGCLVEGCDRKHRRNGYCELHSARILRQGDPLKVGSNLKYDCSEDRKAAIKKSQRVYYKTPKGRAANVLKRHRRNAGEDVKLIADEIQIVIKRFDGKCFKCKSPDDSTLDHHIPLAKGGKLELSNVVILCRKCNGLKADLDPSEFYTTDELISLEKSLKNRSSNDMDK